MVNNLTSEEKEVIEANVDDWMPLARNYLARKFKIGARSRSKFNPDIGQKHYALKLN